MDKVKMSFGEVIIYKTAIHSGTLRSLDSVHILGWLKGDSTYSVKRAVNLVPQPWFKNYAIVYTEQKLDNVFEYSLSKLESSELYNWTMQTAIYTGVSTMTTQLGITGNIIPIIVCYWFFMTIIYIIIDIILNLFKILTHMFNKKTN